MRGFALPFGEETPCAEHLFRPLCGHRSGMPPASRASRLLRGRLSFRATAFPLGGRWVSAARPDEGVRSPIRGRNALRRTPLSAALRPPLGDAPGIPRFAPPEGKAYPRSDCLPPWGGRWVSRARPDEGAAFIAPCGVRVCRRCGRRRRRGRGRCNLFRSVFRLSPRRRAVRRGVLC